MLSLTIALLLSGTPTAINQTLPLRHYFATQTATHDCHYGDQVHTVKLIDDDILSSYATILARAKEPSFLTPRSDGATILRFIWLRSFHAPIIVRLTMPNQSKGRVEMIRFSGLGGYDYGQVKDRKSRAVDQGEVISLLADADPALLEPATPSCGPPGTDGARWLIERSDASGHHFAERWSPDDGIGRATGIALIRLAGLEGEEIY